MSQEEKELESNNPVTPIVSPPPLPERMKRSNSIHNPLPQQAPGASAAIGHILGNSIPLSIFPISDDKLCFCFCGLPGLLFYSYFLFSLFSFFLLIVSSFFTLFFFSFFLFFMYLGRGKTHIARRLARFSLSFFLCV